MTTQPGSLSREISKTVTASAIAMHGQPAMEPGFSAFAYVNPNAPQGGRLTLSALGTFDSLNPFIIKGSAPGFLRGKMYESLMMRAYDEPFTLYPLIARTITTDTARSFVEFHLDPNARFSDGSALTSADVLFSFALLKAKGRPNYRLYYGKVAQAEAPDAHSVRFTFSGPDPELALIMGLMPVLSSQQDPETFEEGGLTPLLGSGPYRIQDMEAGASITLKRNPNYWGRDLPVNRGMHNFETLRFVYFRDANSEFEAFKKGLIDARFETDPTRWQTGYVFPAMRDGAVVKETIPTGVPQPYSALVFNTRRPLFADIRVRQALIELFDFEWLNRNFYYGLYARTGSFFQGSHLSALNQPANALERQLLAPFAAEIVPNVLEGTYLPPVSDGSGRDRTHLQDALQLLSSAGWVLRDQHMVHETDGALFAFEIMVATREQERLALAYANQLRRAGITAHVRYVDNVQFNARRKSFDFDMMPNTWQQSLSPGNEQAFYFGSKAAQQPGTRNYMGMQSPAADAAITALVLARDEAHFVAATRALDRVLVSGAYAIPLFHTPGQWLARWSRIAHPDHPSLYGTLSETWWRVPGK
ncbi:MAG: extracellular solute-binding protein [Xanthobacter sp.]